MATTGDLDLATSGYFYMAMDSFSIFQSFLCADTAPSLPTVSYQHIDITLPGGGQQQLNGGLRPACPGLNVTGFSLPLPPPTAEPLDALDATVTLDPDQPATGGHLRYIVALANPTNQPVSLRPCPHYTEDVLDVSGQPVTQTYGLNCSSVAAIPARHTVQFAMDLRVPPGDNVGPRPLVDWTLIAPDGNKLNLTTLND